MAVLRKTESKRRMIYGSSKIEIASDISQVIFSDDAIQHLLHHRQLQPNQPEQGGQLFATFADGSARIEMATGPHKGVKSGRLWFRGNRRREKAEIKSMFRKGLHYIGDWHSHPEPIPTPSQLDMKTQRSLVAKSDYELEGLLLVIVGQCQSPEGLSVTFVARGGQVMPLHHVTGQRQSGIAV